MDLDAAIRVNKLLKPQVRSTLGPQVLGDVGLFGGLFRLQGYRAPVLVTSADGVCTKVKLALLLDRFDSLGHDLVNHCVNNDLTTDAGLRSTWTTSPWKRWCPGRWGPW